MSTTPLPMGPMGPMGPQEIHDRLVAAKGGDVSRVVYVGIGGGSECTGPHGDAFDAIQVKSLTALFEAQGQGVFWDLCMRELKMAFQTAIDGVVSDACVRFVS